MKAYSIKNQRQKLNDIEGGNLNECNDLLLLWCAMTHSGNRLSTVQSEILDEKYSDML